MLRAVWPWLGGLAIVIGLIAQNAAIAVLGIAALVAFGVARQWARWSLLRLTYERIIPEDHAFSGERIGVTLRLTNRKRLPLPWLEASEQFPEPLAAGQAEFVQGYQPETMRLDWRTSAGARQRITRGLDLLAPERGVYEIGPVRLRSGDPFGFFSEERVDERRRRVIVYPRTVTLPPLALPARRPYGEDSDGMPMFEDLSRIAGLREYAAGDSLRRIDWKATARSGVLQSRVYEPASSRHLLICLNTQTLVPAWAGFIRDVLERSVVVAASLARDAYDRRFTVGLLANSSVVEADRSIRIAPGRRPEQFIRILEALAMVTPFVLEPLSTLLGREEHRLGVGTTVVVVTGLMTDDLAATLTRVDQRGHSVIVLSTSGETWPEVLGRIPVHDLSQIDAEAWKTPAGDRSSGDGEGERRPAVVSTFGGGTSPEPTAASSPNDRWRPPA
ncbi:MAG: DUF58 domain-containing protein [Gemmatimonadaceae bacterium]